MFVDGQLAVCPYIVFAARTPQSRHKDTEFLVGNIFTDEVGPALDAYDFASRYTLGANDQCGGCGANSSCGKGCPAAVISRGGIIGDVDHEQCPVSRRSTIAPDRSAGGVSALFVVIEGPNGVGKTTAAGLLAARLRERLSSPVHLTTEPSNTPLGRLLRSSESVLTGRALALAIATATPTWTVRSCRSSTLVRTWSATDTCSPPWCCNGLTASVWARSGATTHTYCHPR